MADFDMPKVGTWEQRGGWVVRRLVADIGLSPEQASGVVGNLGFESKGFTDLQEDRPLVPGSMGGAGWAQWTGMKPGQRRYLFEAWCAAHNLTPASDEANYGFLLEELTGSYKAFTAKLKQCATIEDACRLTHKLYETPSDVLDGSYRSGPDRLHWAQRALAGAMNAPAGSQGPLADSGAVRPPPANCDADQAAAMNVQLGLRLSGDYDGAIDGIWGPGSKAALNEFQKRHV